MSAEAAAPAAPASAATQAPVVADKPPVPTKAEAVELKRPDIVDPKIREAADKAKDAPKTDAKPEEKPEERETPAEKDVRSRLARIAAADGKQRLERETFEKERAAFKDKQDAADRWEKLQAAVKGGKRLDALRAIYDDKTLAEVYQQELTDLYLAEGKEPTPEDIVKQATAAARAELEVIEAERKKAEAEKAKEESVKQYQDAINEYVAKGDTAWDSKDNATKWPSLRTQAELGNVAPEAFRQAFVKKANELSKELTEKNGKPTIPAPEEVLDAIERNLAAHLSKKTTPTVEAERAVKTQTTTVTGDWSASGVPTVAPETKSFDERLKERKRQFGLS